MLLATSCERTMHTGDPTLLKAGAVAAWTPLVKQFLRMFRKMMRSARKNLGAGSPGNPS
jgi:hypothetical protein